MFKRALCLLLTLLMALTLCVPAMTEGDADVTPTTDGPAVTDTPAPSQTPEPTAEPEPTEEPAAPAPEATEEPEATVEPEPTEGPAAPAPEAAEEPEPTVGPEPAEEPEPTEEPEAMAEPLSLEDGIEPIAAPYTPDTTGRNFANLVLFVYFQDQTDGDSFFRERSAKLHDLYDGASNLSFAKYLDIISGGKLKVLDLMPQYQEGAIAAFQLPCRSTDNISDYELLKSALDALANTAEIPAGSLDLNGDGDVDNVTLVVRGGQGLTPRKGNDGLNSLSGKRVGTYNILYTYELIEKLGGTMGDEVGLAAHEFLHSLGYPDLYRSGANDYPVYTWDIMGGVSARPSWPLAYLRMYFTKWTELKTVTADQTLTFCAPGESGDQAYILQSPTNDSELFVVEMRRKNGSMGNGSVPDSAVSTTMDYGEAGLIVYRVDTKVEGLSNFRGGTGVYVFRPGGAATSDAVQKAYLNEASGRTSMGSADMSKGLTDGALTFSSGANSGIVIQNVKTNGDGTMSCDVVFPAVESGSLWEDTKVPSNTNKNAIATAVQGDTVYSAVYDGSQFTLYRREGDSWTSAGPSFSTDAFGAASLVFHGGKLYLGYQDGSGALKVRSFDPAASTWTDVSAPVGAVSDFTMQSLDGELYIACSRNGSFQAALYKLAGGSFTEQKVYHNDLCGRAQVTAADGGLYTAVRQADQIVTVYDSTGRRVSDGSIKTALNYSLAALGGKVTVVTSDSTGTAVWTYDGGAWSSVSDAAITSTDSKAVVIGGALYLVSANSGGTRVYRYDPAAGTWTQVGELAASTDADQIGLSADGEYLYISYAHGGSVYVRRKALPASGGGETDPTEPTPTPTTSPFPTPTTSPSPTPTTSPSPTPSTSPTADPTTSPAADPTASPAADPTTSPAADPTTSPVADPTASPVADPTTSPTADPTTSPATDPTTSPTADPTTSPSTDPTTSPAASPSTKPAATDGAAPATGDETPVALYAAIMLLCLGGLVLALTIRKKQEH